MFFVKEICLFVKIKNHVAKTTLIIVLDVDYCFFFVKNSQRLPYASFDKRVFYYFQRELQNCGEL